MSSDKQIFSRRSKDKLQAKMYVWLFYLNSGRQEVKKNIFLREWISVTASNMGFHVACW